MFSKDLSDWWIHNDIQYIDLMVKETQCFYFLFFMFFYAWCLSLFIMSRTTMSRTCCNFSQAVSCSKNALDLGFLAFEKPIEALPKPKRTKRTNLWRLETARNWNFWKLWDMIFFWTFRMLSIDESRVFAAKVCKSLWMRHLMQFTDSHDSLNFSWPRVDAIPKVPGCGFECGRWRFLCFWSQIWIP